MGFLNSPRVTESDQLLKIETNSINVKGIAIFMTLVVLACAAVVFFSRGSNEAVFVLAVGMMAGGMFAGMFYLASANRRNRVLPCIDKNKEQLVLASGSVIPKQSIECFRQYNCKTKMSNFRLVLTTVVVRASNELLEYAVTPVIGKFSEDCIGAPFASFFDTRLIQDSSRTFTVNELSELGLN